jgi:UbiD family decarboxylase
MACAGEFAGTGTWTREVLEAASASPHTLRTMSSAREQGAPAVHGPERRAPRDLRTFLDVLRRDDRVVEVEVPVDAELEVAEIHRRVIAAGGPALVFRNVKGARFPLVTNLFGTARRVELAFGSKPGALIAQAAKLPEELMPPTLGKLWSKRSLFWSLAKVGMKRGARGAVLEVTQTPPRMSELPALKTWPRDGGRFVTLPLVYTQHPVTNGPNLGMYRIQIFDDATCGMHMQIGKGGGFHLAEAEALGRNLPVNLFIGGPPALILGAIAPLPENVPELLLTSLMLGERVRLADNPHGPLPLVADAEFAIVGEIAAKARRPEGPFGDHYGYYSETHDYPFMRVKALMHRRDAIYPATVVGKPRQEDFYLGDFLQELLSPLFPVVMPAVRDLWSYGETGYHSLSAAVVRERYKREAMSSAFRILGEGQLSLTKFLLLTNQSVDLRDFRATLEHILARADFRTDLFVFANLSMDSLDYAGPRVNEGGKGVLLGVGEPIRALKSEFNGTPGAGVRRVRPFAKGCLVVECARFAEAPDAPQRIARDPAFADWPLLVLSDDAERHVKSPMNFLWATFTRFNPASDIHAARVELVANHPSFTPPIVIDARMKPWYPEELFCDEATAQLVTRRWKEYFPSGLEMGDSDRGHLD